VMNAGEGCVETVEEIIDLRFWYAARISVSHRPPFLSKGDLWSGTVRASTRACPVFFYVTDFGEGCNEKEVVSY
jgi:hypothetical protein